MKGGSFVLWKRLRGYGVHSPEAFRLVQRVVKSPGKVCYYGEEVLSTRDADSRLLRQARLLLRLTAYLQPAFVWTSPGIPALMTEAVSLAGEVIRIFDGKVYPDKTDEADLIVVYKKPLTKSVLDKAIAAGKSIVAFEVPEKFVETAFSRLKSGVFLEWRTGFILEPIADSEKYHYPI